MLISRSLVQAARDGRIDVVETLLRSGCLVSEKDRRGRSALHWASARAYREAGNPVRCPVPTRLPSLPDTPPSATRSSSCCWSTAATLQPSTGTEQRPCTWLPWPVQSARVTTREVGAISGTAGGGGTPRKWALIPRRIGSSRPTKA